VNVISRRAILDAGMRHPDAESALTAWYKVAKLMSTGPELPQAESELLEILSLLVAQYESIECPIRDASPAEMLAFLIDARGVSNAAVARATGIPRSVITDILAGRRNISTANVAKLAKYFHVSPAVFIAEPERGNGNRLS